MNPDIDGKHTPRAHDWLIDRVFAPLVPEDVREAFIGDLVEEARRFVIPERGHRRARWWLRGQLFRSLPQLLRHRAAQEARMLGLRLSMALLMVIIGTLQAWDSQVHRSAPPTIAFVVAAIILTALTTLFARRRVAHLFPIMSVPLLYLLARLLSPTPLPDLFVLVPVNLLVLLWLGGWLPLRQGTARRI